MNFLTRKDVARVADVEDVRTVKANEPGWGLLPFKKPLNKRVIRYRPVDSVLKALVNAGVIDSVEEGKQRLK